MLDGAALDDPSREPKPVPGSFSMLDRSDPGRTPEAGCVLGAEWCPNRVPDSAELTPPGRTRRPHFGPALPNRPSGADLLIGRFQVRFLAGASEAAGAELGRHAAKGKKRRTEGGERLFDGEAAKVSEGPQ